MHIPQQGESDKEGNICEDLERTSILHQFPKQHMNILLCHVNGKAGLPVGNESSHETSYELVM
jgi:hypothetical protein